MAQLPEAIEARRAELFELLRTLIAFRTESQAREALHFPDEARRCMAFLRAELEQLGFVIETWDVGPSATFDAHPAIVARRPGTGGGRSVAFNAHVDVVPVGDAAAWSHPPFAGELEDGRVWGRGAADMKGGLAAALFAVRLALEGGFQPAGDILFHLVSDEEVVGNGSRETAARTPRPDAVISLEPSSLALSLTEGGLVHFRIEVEGVEAHAGSRHLSVHAGGGGRGGVNAIEKMLKLIASLQDLERHWANTKAHPLLPPGYDTLLPGIIVGGPGGGSDGRLNLFSNAGTTPNYCSVEYNLWFYPFQSLDEVRAEVEAWVAAAAATDPWLSEHPPRFSWAVNSIYFPAADVPVDHPMVEVMTRAMTDIGLDPTPVGFGAATDLAWYAELGIPGFIFGAGNLEQCHVADEWIDADALVAAAKAYALFVERWCA